MKKVHQAKNLKRRRAKVRKLEEAKQELEECYIKTWGKYIERKVENKQSRVVWETANEISGRKVTNRGKLKADNPAERVKLWEDHFVNLLGRLPETTNIEPISS